MRRAITGNLLRSQSRVILPSTKLGTVSLSNREVHF